MTATYKVTVALDFANLKDVKNLVSQLSPDYCNLKVGKELFTATGPAFVEYLHSKNFKVFLDQSSQIFDQHLLKERGSAY